MGGSNANLLEEVRATKRDITTAHTTFITHFNTFLSLAEQLEVRLKEVEGRELEVEKKENKLKGADQQYEERERRSLGKEKEVEERERTVLEMETRWKETEKKMEANAAKLPTIIKLNISMTMTTHSPLHPSLSYLITHLPCLSCHHTITVTPPSFLLTLSFLSFFYLHPFFLLLPLPPSSSLLFSSPGGIQFALSKETLLQHKGSLFEQMIVSNHSQQLPSGEYVTIPLHSTFHFILLLLCSFLPAQTGSLFKETLSSVTTSSAILYTALSSSPPMSSSERRLNKSSSSSGFHFQHLQHLHQLRYQDCSYLEAHCMCHSLYLAHSYSHSHSHSHCTRLTL